MCELKQPLYDSTPFFWGGGSQNPLNVRDSKFTFCDVGFPEGVAWVKSGIASLRVEIFKGPNRVDAWP